MGPQRTTMSFSGMIKKPRGPEAAGAAAKTRRWHRLALVLVIAVPLCALGTYYTYVRYRASSLARTVRELTNARKRDQAKLALRRWLEMEPQSAEAHYYQARLAMDDDRPDEAFAAIQQAFRLGFDQKLLSCLMAIIQARSNYFLEAEPVLLQAYREELEPKLDVARELARGYLSSYRLNEAADPIERCKTLAPDDPQPYLWRNEIETRSAGEASTIIQNYRAALDRDPTLKKARLGLAEELANGGKSEESEREYKEYLKQNPGDAVALVGLGRNVLRRGEIEAATQYFQDALQANPRQLDANRELAQIELRQRRYEKACQRLRMLTEIEPSDREIRYAYAQALRLTGNEAEAKVQNDLAAKLRETQDLVLTLRSKVLANPRDLVSRYQVAVWMFEHGHSEEGLKWAKDILRIDARHAPTHRLMADYYASKGESGLANYHRLMATD
ncbi:MAG: tetratricopeptide repeat protein [Isosphaeraceae bacterium]